MTLMITIVSSFFSRRFVATLDGLTKLYVDYCHDVRLSYYLSYTPYRKLSFVTWVRTLLLFRLERFLRLDCVTGYVVLIVPTTVETNRASNKVTNFSLVPRRRLVGFIVFHLGAGPDNGHALR